MKNLSEANPVFKASAEISTVPEYNWYRGCTTTASTMILSYWGLYKGYSGFSESPDKVQWTRPKDYFWGIIKLCASSPSDIKIPKDLADELANAMSLPANCGYQNSFGALTSKQASAMQTVAKNHGYSFKVTRPDKSSIKTYMSEIDAGRPVIISCNTAAISSSKGNHSNAGYGYNKISETECVLYLRNTGDKNNTWKTYFTYQTAIKLGYMKEFITFVPY